MKYYYDLILLNNKRSKKNRSITYKNIQSIKKGKILSIGLILY